MGNDKALRRWTAGLATRACCIPFVSSPPASCRWNAGLETLVVAKPGSTGVKPAGASVRFLVAFWFPDLGFTDARSNGVDLRRAGDVNPLICRD